MPVTKDELQAAIDNDDQARVERVGIRKLVEMNLVPEEAQAIVQILNREQLLELFEEPSEDKDAEKRAKSIASDLKKLIKNEKWEEAKDLAVKIVGISKVRKDALKALGQVAHRPVPNSEKLQRLINEDEFVEAEQMLSEQLKAWLGFSDEEINDLMYVLFRNQNDAIPYFEDAEKGRWDRKKLRDKAPDKILDSIQAKKWEEVIAHAVKCISLDPSEKERVKLKNVVKETMALLAYESLSQIEREAAISNGIKKITQKKGKSILDDQEVRDIVLDLTKDERRVLMAGGLYYKNEKKVHSKLVDDLKREQEKEHPDMQKLVAIALKILSIKGNKDAHRRAFSQIYDFKAGRKENLFNYAIGKIESSIVAEDWDGVISAARMWRELDPEGWRLRIFETTRFKEVGPYQYRAKQKRRKESESGKGSQEIEETINNAEDLKIFESEDEDEKRRMMANKIIGITDGLVGRDEAEAIAAEMPLKDGKELFINGLYLRGVKRKILAKYMDTLERERQKKEPDVQKITNICLKLLAIKVPNVFTHWEARDDLKEMLAKMSVAAKEAEEAPEPERRGEFQTADISDLDLKKAEKERQKRAKKEEVVSEKSRKEKEDKLSRRQLLAGGLALAGLALGDLIVKEVQKPRKATQFSKALDAGLENLDQWRSGIDWGSTEAKAKEAKTETELERLTKEANEIIKNKGGVFDHNTGQWFYPHMRNHIIDSPLVELDMNEGFFWIDKKGKKHPYRLKQVVADALMRAHNKMKEDGLKGVRVNSAFRTHGHQMKLIERYKAGDPEIIAVGPPGGGGHGNGQSIDVQNYKEAMKYLTAEKFEWLGPGDKVHFNYGIPVHQTLKTRMAEGFLEATGEVRAFMNDPDKFLEEHLGGAGVEARKKAAKVFRGAKKWFKGVDFTPWN